MPNNVENIDHSLAVLNQAIKDHYQWGGALLCLNLFGGEAGSDLVADDSHIYCQFNKWLEGRKQGDALNINMVMAIDRWHHSMHDIARILAQAVVSGDVSKSLVTQYNEQQQLFIDSIDAYRVNLLTMRNEHDALTALPLRNLLYQEFPSYIDRCNRHQTKLFVLMLDIDHFKSINDTWGHNAGDEVLRIVAQRLKSSTVDTNRLYRFGGEEFIFLLEAQDNTTAQFAAEKIRKSLASYDVNYSGKSISVTATIGMTCVSENNTLNEAIGRADHAMYYGKNNGRNCCVMDLNDENGPVIFSH